MKIVTYTLSAIFLLSSQQSHAQACSTAQGDQNAYGSNNVWIGYVYTGQNFNTYMGYVNEGATGSPNFDESFGGATVTYNTNGCSITTDNFSVRYKLSQPLTGNYTITVSGDDGYRLSLDGGTTWAIDNFTDHGYQSTPITVNLSGTTNFVLEYYENGGDNRVTFNMVQNCSGTGDPSVYGTNNVWRGYMYQGMNFDVYKGFVTEGNSLDPNFDENFGNPGGGAIQYNTNSCYITTQQFSAHYRLNTTLTPATYVITVGGDDGYRLSLDGGSNWVINQFFDQAYAITTYTANLSGNYNMLLDYNQDGGADRLSFSMSSSTLPVTLSSWSATAQSANQALLKWTATDAVNFDHFIIQRSTDGQTFEDVHTVNSTAASSGTSTAYSYTDLYNFDGTVYYRLEMVDVDNKASYSSVLALPLRSQKPVRIYPTVVENGNLFVESASTISQAKLELFDMNGRKLQEKDWSSLQGRQQVSVNGGTLPAGAYIARLSDSQSTLVKQIILVK
jgi:hypothetical protein